ncbi:piggyBac transposable element-derived protein 4-like [Pyxicephalus adspersus]|uniref:piggyBac transposable element-derived protein 4-like n=1 Tax=Pyxicephalus adspersus TaxID=30357 RepID=UPI003B594143
MQSMFAKGKLKTGEIVAWQKREMMALRWRNKKDVCLMSTVHDASTVLVHTKRGKEVMKPQVVIDYNNTMGGVDRSDQAMTFYPAMRKKHKKYNKKIFRHLVEQCLWNAYIFYTQKSDRPGNHSDLILKVSESFVKNHQTWSSPPRRLNHQRRDTTLHTLKLGM